MISFDEWEQITETAFWRSQPGIMEDIATAKAEIERGDYVTADELLADARRRLATERNAG